MHGIGEIRKMNADINAAQRDLPQTKREADYRVQRDKLAQALRRVLAKDIGAEAFAQKVLAEIG